MGLSLLELDFVYLKNFVSIMKALINYKKRHGHIYLITVLYIIFILSIFLFY